MFLIKYLTKRIFSVISTPRHEPKGVCNEKEFEPIVRKRVFGY